MGTTLPATLPGDAVLIFRAYVWPFVLYLDGEPLYSFRLDGADTSGEDLTVHVVSLPEGAAGKPLQAWVRRARLAIAFSESWPIVERRRIAGALTAYLEQPLGQGAVVLALGSVLVVIGLLAVVVGLRRLTRPDWLTLSFGAFATLYGLRLASSSSVLLFLGLPLAKALYVQSFITYAIHVPAWSFFLVLIGGGRVLKWGLGLAATFAVCAVIADATTGGPFAAGGLPNNLLVLLGLVVVTWYTIRRRWWVGQDLGPLVFGLAVLMVTSVHDNLGGLGVMIWGGEIEPLGFTVFVGCLGLVTARRIQRGAARLAGLEAEVEAARRIQSSLLPRHLPSLDGATLEARFVPASEVAGDLYHLLESDARRIGILVADVAGHGMPAALVASMVKVAFSSARPLAAQPTRLLDEMNRILCANLDVGFVTAVYAWVDLEAGEVRLSSGGHPRPLLRRADGAVMEIAAQGPLLGRFRDASFEERRVEMVPGERILFFTDGIVEARGPGDEPFGEERLAALLRASRLGDGLLDQILDDVADWQGGGDADPADDRTLFLLSRSEV